MKDHIIILIAIAVIATCGTYTITTVSTTYYNKVATCENVK